MLSRWSTTPSGIADLTVGFKLGTTVRMFVGAEEGPSLDVVDGMSVGAEEGPSLDVVDGMFVGAEEGTKLGVTEGLLVGLEKGAEVGLSVTTNISERRTPAAKQLLIASRLAEDSKTNAVPAQDHVTGLTKRRQPSFPFSPTGALP